MNHHLIYSLQYTIFKLDKFDAFYFISDVPMNGFEATTENHVHNKETIKHDPVPQADPHNQDHLAENIFTGNLVYQTYFSEESPSVTQFVCMSREISFS